MIQTAHISPGIQALSREILAEFKPSFKDHEADITGLLEKARTQLIQRNDKIRSNPTADRKALTDDQIEHVLDALRDLMVDELVSLHPTQQALSQSRQMAFEQFPIRKEININLDTCSIEALLTYVFNTRVDILTDTLRQLAKERQAHNDRLDALNQLKTQLAGHQPQQGEAIKTVTIADSHANILTLDKAAKMAGFDFSFYKQKDLNDESAVFELSFAHYQQLMTALSGYADKLANLSTTQQLTLTETEKQRSQTIEIRSMLSKKWHDTNQTIIHNLK